MKKLISLISILFLLTLFVSSKQAEAARGSGGFHGSGERGGFRGFGGHEGFHRFGRHEGFRGHGGFLPGFIIGGTLGWGLWPYYYPPDYYYYYYPPPPNYYYPPPANYYYLPPVQNSQVPPPASEGSGAKIFIYPRQGQNEQKQADDQFECHTWAVGQTGYDPTKTPSADLPFDEMASRRADYFRAFSACLDAHGYTVR
jgi:hypothetical protein